MGNPLINIIALASPHHTLLVQDYAFGQFRIQITDKRIYDPHAPPGHGAIVIEA